MRLDEGVECHRPPRKSPKPCSKISSPSSNDGAESLESHVQLQFR